jgi:uncharacterized delta-60 repeat protein
MRIRQILVATLLLGAPSAVLPALDGDLDPTFWSGGAVLLDGAVYFEVTALLSAPDGRLVVTGSHRDTFDGAREWFWQRVDDDSADAVCYFPFPGATTATNSAATFDGAGRLLLAGDAVYSGSSRLAAARFAYPACLLDDAFDGDGYWTLDIAGGQERLRAVATSDLGEVAFGGIYDPTAGSRDLLVVLTSSSGALDPTFSGNGWLTFDPSAAGLFDEVVGIAFDSAGRVVVGGTTLFGDADGGDDWMVTRFTPEGDPDGSFDVDGVARVAFDLESPSAQRDILRAMAIDPNGGEIVLAGAAESDSVYDSALARLLPSGAPDVSFSGDGKLNTSLSGARSELKAVAVDGLGRIYASGFRTPPTLNADFVALRTTAAGALDASFSTDGWTTLGFDASPPNVLDYSTAAALDDGRWAVAGDVQVGTGAAYRPGLARFEVALIFADGVESGSAGQWTAVVGTP